MYDGIQAFGGVNSIGILSRYDHNFLVSISPIFQEQLFHTKVFCAAFMCLQFGFVTFGRKDFGAKAAHKILVKLTPGRHDIQQNDIWLNCVSWFIDSYVVRCQILFC
jgi:putative cofactor-binding repeat protein